MSRNFTQVVEDVKQLSPAEKQELQALLRNYLIEERRQQILENYRSGLEELDASEVKFFSSIETLKDQLSHD